MSGDLKLASSFELVLDLTKLRKEDGEPNPGAVVAALKGLAANVEAYGLTPGGMWGGMIGVGEMITGQEGITLKAAVGYWTLHIADVEEGLIQ